MQNDPRYNNFSVFSEINTSEVNPNLYLMKKCEMKYNGIKSEKTNNFSSE